MLWSRSSCWRRVFCSVETVCSLHKANYDCIATLPLFLHVNNFAHSICRSFPSHFNESLMFNSTGAAQLKTEFREKFRNISKIMDCVGCDKCRLWGKLQVQGLGTALKILFSEKFDLSLATGNPIKGTKGPENRPIKLKRGEIVSLFNAFGRWDKTTMSFKHLIFYFC